MLENRFYYLLMRNNIVYLARDNNKTCLTKFPYTKTNIIEFFPYPLNFYTDKIHVGIKILFSYQTTELIYDSITIIRRRKGYAHERVDRNIE